jgi:hypothetical protein
MDTLAAEVELVNQSSQFVKLDVFPIQIVCQRNHVSTVCVAIRAIVDRMPSAELRNINQFARADKDMKEILKMDASRSDAHQTANVHRRINASIDNVCQRAAMIRAEQMPNVLEFITKQRARACQDLRDHHTRSA